MLTNLVKTFGQLWLLAIIFTYERRVLFYRICRDKEIYKVTNIFFFFFLGEVRIPGVKNKIYYEPDSGDDWDDEDPDEDLDL